MADVKQMLPEQQGAIDSIKNTVVAAGAGSGKTTVLSLRYLNLVKKYKYNVDEILTLTFTKKATVEMSSRIYSVLKKDAPEQAAIFYKANIKTLDSYCNSVAKLGCRYYGISPDFVQDDAAIRTQVKSKALPFLLEHRDNEALKEFIKVQDYEEVADSLFIEPVLAHSKIASPIDFRADFKKQIEKVAEEWNKTVQNIAVTLDQIENFEQEFSGNRESKSFDTFLKEKEKNAAPEPLVVSAEILENQGKSFIGAYAERINEINYSKPRVKGDEVDAVKEAIDLFRSAKDDLLSLANYIYGLDCLEKILPLLEEFQEIVMNVKRTSNCLTFADVSNMALKILCDYPEIRAIEKEKYKAIMIDEFQDNNIDQRNMLFLLAEKKERMEKGVPTVEELEKEKLFFVGDEKQSIYRFRGADVEVFNNLAGDFSDGTLQMYTNHRSNPKLIAAFNTIFGGNLYAYAKAENVEFDRTPPAVFYTEAQQKSGAEIPSYEAVYHPVLADEKKVEAENQKKNSDKKVNLAFYYKDTEAPAGYFTGTYAEAEWVAKKIAEKHEKEGYDFSDMAVLFRSYSQQAVFERAFLRHGIPYNTETVKGFFSDGPVSDIAAYLKLCAYSDDRMAYAKVLSSPFVNLSVTETQAVLSLKQDAFSEGAQEVLEGDSLIRFKNAAGLFEEFKDFAKENSLTKTVFKLWYDFGYRFETMWNETVRMYEKLYDLLFALAREGDEKNLNLAGFVDGLCEYEEENSKLEINIPVEKSEGVHIMTVHKSKGLEFKIVFVCDTQRGSVKEKSVVPVYYSSRYGFVLNTPLHFDAKNYFYLLAKRENELKQCAEMRRLTYVALTRAEDEIFITNSNYEIPKEVEEYMPGGTKNADSIFKTLTPVIAFYSNEEQSDNFSYEDVSPFSKIERIEPFIPSESGGGARRKNNKKAREEFVSQLKKENFYEQAEIIKKETVEKKYVSPSKLYGEAENLEQTRVYSNDELKNLPFFEINEIVQKHSGFDFDNFGTIAHSYLENAVKFGGQKVKVPYNNQDIAALENSTADIKKVEEICGVMAENFLQSELGKQVQSAVWKKEEFEFKSRFGEKILSGIIDLVFESVDGSFTVVDYKTNQEIHPEIYYSQLACYRQAVSQMLSVPEEKIRCFLYYLRFGKAVEISPENLKLSDI